MSHSRALKKRLDFTKGRSEARAKTAPSKGLETFPNPNPARDYGIHMEIPEFTCLCPKTGQPDFATLYLDYVPDRACVELKSLKLYIWSFRDLGKFHEAVTNEILDDLVAAVAPRYMRSRPSSSCAAGSTPPWSPSTASPAGRALPIVLPRLRSKADRDSR
jgi:7-cyano-7-deazaguanine reductase